MTDATRSRFQGMCLRAALCTLHFIVIVLAAAFGFGRAYSAPGANPGCVLVEKEGKVEFARKGSTAWSAAQLNQGLQPGDRLRTGSRSRAALRWSELSVVRVSELTSMEIQ